VSRIRWILPFSRDSYRYDMDVAIGVIQVNAIPISYGEFYDFPRMIRFSSVANGISCDRTLTMRRMNTRILTKFICCLSNQKEITSNPNYWKELTKAFHLGRISIGQVGLDETRRKSIDRENIELWLSARKTVNGKYAELGLGTKT